MKYILSLVICSSVSSTCMPPVTSNIMYENTYKCLIDGYKNSIKIMESIGEEEVNKHDLYAKFVCIEQKQKEKINEDI